MRDILITGANRGIGLEFVKRYLAKGERVLATCRDPENAEALESLRKDHRDNLMIFELDVVDDDTISFAIQQIKLKTDKIDILINNAGVFPRGENPRNVTRETMLDTYNINCAGPVLVLQGCIDLLAAAPQGKVLNVSSHFGSIEHKKSGGYFSYCASKAALNMLTRTFAFALKDSGIITVTMTPGWVRTDMGGDNAPLSVEESVSGMMMFLDKMKPKHNAGFFTWKGKRHDW